MGGLFRYLSAPALSPRYLLIPEALPRRRALNREKWNNAQPNCSSSVTLHRFTFILLSCSRLVNCEWAELPVCWKTLHFFNSSSFRSCSVTESMVSIWFKVNPFTKVILNILVPVLQLQTHAKVVEILKSRLEILCYWKLLVLLRWIFTVKCPGNCWILPEGKYFLLEWIELSIWWSDYLFLEVTKIIRGKCAAGEVFSYFDAYWCLYFPCL